MRLITTILLFVCGNAKATIYYVDNAGNDNNNGTSTGTAWQTIAKVNSSSFSAGDQILFKKGGSWNERLNPPSSGSVGNVITFGSYGSGAKPIITGFQTLSMEYTSLNFWSDTFTNSAKYQNTVYINGALRAKGRYPNTGYLSITSHSGKGQITGATSGNYTGGEVVIRNNHWTTDHLYITSQSGGTVNFSPETYYNITDGYGYFFQNHISTLDTLNEWCYDTTTKIIIIYATSEPTVKASSIDTLVNLNSKNYITFDGIYFEGANITAFQVSTSHNITITNCDMVNMGANGVSGQLSNFLTVSYSTFSNCWNDAICMIDFATALADSDDATFTYNTIANTGTKSGMGKNRFMTYTAITAFGDRSTVTNNTITNTGYIGLYFYGDTCLVKNNYVDTFCYVKDDGGGLYTFSGTGTPKSGGIIRSNIVTNGMLAPGTDGGIQTWAIYLDNESKYITIDSNTVFNNLVGMFVHESHYLTFRENIVYNNTYQSFVVSNVTTPGGAASAHVTFKQNTLVSQPTDLVYYALMSVTEPNFDVMDSNYYYNQFDSNKIVRNNIYYSLKAWQDSTGFDTHTLRKPSGTTSATPLLKYNRTASPVTQALSGTYINSKGASFTNAITLQPFQSSLLYKAMTDDIPVSIPTYYPVRKLKFKKIKL